MSPDPVPDHLLAPLHAAYTQRLAGLAGLATARAAGQVVVGFVGNTVPVELLTACGARALRIAPDAGPAQAADTHVEPFADRDCRLIFAAFCAGRYDTLDLLVVPRSSESWHKLYLALREAVRTGLKTGGPALWLHDVPHTQRDSSRQYGLARTRDLLQQVAQRTGHTPTAADIGAAIAQANVSRRLLQQLQALRLQGRVSGWQAQVATGALAFLAPAEGQAALQAWLASVATAPVFNGPRLAVQGVPLDHAALHAAVDAAGARIVLEDDDWGSRAAAPLIDEQAAPLQAVFDHYWRDVPCLRIHPAPAGPSAFARAWQQRQIDGVLFNLPRPDDLHGWRLPAWRAEADALQLPWLQLRDDARDEPTRAALQQALARFIGPLRPTA